MGKIKKTEDVNGTGYEWEYAKKVDNRTTSQKILNFIYNPQTHAFLGRTAKSWGGILLFYAIFYSILALLFAICMKVLLSTIDPAYPKWQLDESIIGSNPGLGFRPRTDNPETASIIWYNFSDSENVQSWVSLLNDFMESEYENKTGSSNKAISPCSHGQKLKADEFCKVTPYDFGECSKAYDYGYKVGKPCVFIKLNRIYGWEPDYYRNASDLPGGMPDQLKNKINSTPEAERNIIWVSCEGQSAHDKENIGRLEYYPKIQGFPSYFYPYYHVKDYMSPLVAVQFVAPKRGVLVNIECKAWAKNIIHKATSHAREGSVHFELQVDGLSQ